MELNGYYLLILSLIPSVFCEICPKECDCDIEAGLNRALCVDQNIINVDIGVPKIVQVYSLSRNSISELDNYCFMELGYTSLEILNLSYNLIFWIGLHAFAGLNKLVQLDLSNNRLRFLPSDLLWDTPELKSLDLSFNVFESLKNEPFLMHSKLEVLNLNSCRIKSLSERLFTRLPNLKKLDLSENYMISLNIEVFRPLRRLQRLKLRNDYWQCTPEFIAVETWILSKSITYEKQCRKVTSKMIEKIISNVITERPEIDIAKVWNVTVNRNETQPSVEKEKPMTPFQKFDKDFSALQSFVIGLEIGLALGIVCTYVWLRSFCKCGQLSCSRPQTRRQARRAQRVRDSSDMRNNLLWSTVSNSDADTPPLYRRELSLPDGNIAYPTYGLPGIREAALQIDAIRVPLNRAETPPPPYNECRLNV